MIQTAVLTWFPRSEQLGAAGWKDEATHGAAWLLSSRLLRERFDEVVLHTNVVGKRQLAHIEVTRVVVRERVLSPLLWGVEKLVSCALTEVPHVHVDGDFFWWNVREKHLCAPILYQSPERMSDGYMRLRRAMLYAAEHGRGQPCLPAQATYCAGVSGGADVRRWRRFAEAQVKDALRLQSLPEKVLARAVERGRYVDTDRFLTAANYWYEQHVPTSHFGIRSIDTLIPNQEFHGIDFDHAIRGRRMSTTTLTRIQQRCYNNPISRNLAHYFEV